ncbi:hypothetical protein JCM3775_000959 [Rhodotorula graminis]
MASPSTQDTGACDEGGVHDFRLPHKSSSGLWKCLCCPCYLICGVALSRGAALGPAPVGFSAGDDRPNELTCIKCGLNPSEASALAQVRDAESQGLSTSKGPGYFSNAGMSVPEPVASSHMRSYSHAGAPGYPPAQPPRQP